MTTRDARWPVRPTILSILAGLMAATLSVMLVGAGLGLLGAWNPMGSAAPWLVMSFCLIGFLLCGAPAVFVLSATTVFFRLCPRRPDAAAG